MLSGRTVDTCYFDYLIKFGSGPTCLGYFQALGFNFTSAGLGLRRLSYFEPLWVEFTSANTVTLERNLVLVSGASVDHGLARDILGYFDPRRILFANITGLAFTSFFSYFKPSGLISPGIASSPWRATFSATSFPTRSTPLLAQAVSNVRMEGTLHLEPIAGLAAAVCTAAAFSVDALQPHCEPQLSS